MKSGFTNFYPVDKAHTIAHDRHGPILTEEGGYLFMPLYQKQGEDGFFLIRPIRPFWLRLSAWLRHRRVDRLLHWLPGVSKLPANENGLHINTQVARWFVVEICHLLGYRKHAQEGDELIVYRRRQTSA
jgi:succinylglutamate desuccinylase